MNQLLPTIIRTLVAAATLSAAALTAHAQGVTGDAQAGQKKADMCIGCHGIPGYQNSFPEIHKVPMISGQTAQYIAASLAAYKKGDRKHPSMRGIAGSLSEQDMADLGAFYASTPARPRRMCLGPPAPLLPH
jgi:cytochrome c553